MSNTIATVASQLELDPWTRYVKDMTPSKTSVWRFDRQPGALPSGKRLRIETMAPAIVRYSTDDWNTVAEANTYDSGMGFYFVDLPTETLKPASKVKFTFRWTQANRWEQRNFQLPVEDRPCSVSH